MSSSMCHQGRQRPATELPHAAGCGPCPASVHSPFSMNVLDKWILLPEPLQNTPSPSAPGSCSFPTPAAALPKGHRLCPAAKAHPGRDCTTNNFPGNRTHALPSRAALGTMTAPHTRGSKGESSAACSAVPTAHKTWNNLPTSFPVCPGGTDCCKTPTAASFGVSQSPWSKTSPQRLLAGIFQTAFSGLNFSLKPYGIIVPASALAHAV